MQRTAVGLANRRCTPIIAQFACAGVDGQTAGRGTPRRMTTALSIDSHQHQNRAAALSLDAWTGPGRRNSHDDDYRAYRQRHENSAQVSAREPAGAEKRQDRDLSALQLPLRVLRAAHARS